MNLDHLFPHSYPGTILTALQGKPMYLGTVPPSEVAKRRVKGRAARKARRLNRSR